MPERERPRAYLAGPDVFLPDAVEVGERKKRICAERGLEGVFPLDKEHPPGGPDKRARGRAIFEGNCELMDSADLVLANMTPFRGIGMDGGTAFEIGYARARGMPVFGYTAAAGTYLERARRAGLAQDAGPPRDLDGLSIEDFDLADNLMLACAVRELVVHAEDRLAAETAFRACVRLAAAQLRGGAGSPRG